MSNLTLPGNQRYQPKSLQPIFGYDNLMRPVGEMELATLDVLADLDFIPKEEMATLTQEKREQILALATAEVDEVERTITHHDIRAWVLLAQRLLGERLGRWVHIPLTSYDPLGTALSLLLARAYKEVVNPKLKEVVALLSENIRRSAKTPMIGRTHGQHALPITAGFWLATILGRVLYNWSILDLHSRGLVGKVSGAVGARNAQIGLGIEKRSQERHGKSFEKLVLEKLGLEPAIISTQIPPPEPAAYFLHSAVLLTGAFGQLGCDCRQLMRSEIGEVSEPFEATQTGSSTMPQKRNPIHWEQLQGMFLRTKSEYGKVLDSLISEHQRDLTGSSLMRDFPIIIVNLVVQLETLLRKNKAGVPFLARLAINEDACKRNLKMSEHVMLAEPWYIALQMAGYCGDAHELINRKAVPMCRGATFLHNAIAQLAENDAELKEAWGRIPQEVLDLLCNPYELERYTGDAEAAALRIVALAEARLKE